MKSNAVCEHCLVRIVYLFDVVATAVRSDREPVRVSIPSDDFSSWLRPRLLFMTRRENVPSTERDRVSAWSTDWKAIAVCGLAFEGKDQQPDDRPLAWNAGGWEWSVRPCYILLLPPFLIFSSRSATVNLVFDSTRQGHKGQSEWNEPLATPMLRYSSEDAILPLDFLLSCHILPCSPSPHQKFNPIT